MFVSSSAKKDFSRKTCLFQAAAPLFGHTKHRHQHIKTQHLETQVEVEQKEVEQKEVEQKEVEQKGVEQKEVDTSLNHLPSVLSSRPSLKSTPRPGSMIPG